MRIFIYEYTCSATIAEHEALGSLRAEGAAMLIAALEDFNRARGMSAFTLLSDGCKLEFPASWCRRAEGLTEEMAVRRLAQEADCTLLIAPECDDLLRSRCLWVEETGKPLLGPPAHVIQRTGDKLALAQHLNKAGVPTPACRLWQPGMFADALSYPAVWKPRHGAGSLATFLVRHADDLAACVAASQAEGWVGESVWQPFIPGQPASVAFLVGPQEHVALMPASQTLSADGRFHYQGGMLPLSPPLDRRAVQLGRRAVQAVAGLRGYVGVDLILGGATDGSQDWVIEINPRLTTSYIGLRALAKINLAEAMLCAAMGEEIPTIPWQAGTVTFTADGACTLAART